MRLARLILLALVAVVALPQVAAAQVSPQEQRKSLMWLLSAHEFRVERRLLDSVGEDVNRQLVHIASDPKVRPTIRSRAVASLAVYPSARTRDYLQSLLYERALEGTTAGVQLRRQAIRSLAWAFREAVVNTLSGLRQDADPQIREATAHALGDTRSPAAERILDAWLPHEPELFVRLAVDRSLDRIRKGKERTP